MPSLRPPSAFCELEPAIAGAQPAELGAGFDWRVLQRHGRRPIAILGRTLLHANNRCAGQSCWSELAIIETVEGRFAVSVGHIVPIERGPTWRDAWLATTPETVREMCRAHDPLIGIPPWQTAGDWAAFDESLRFRAAWCGLLGALFGLPTESEIAT